MSVPSALTKGEENGIFILLSSPFLLFEASALFATNAYFCIHSCFNASTISGGRQTKIASAKGVSPRLVFKIASSPAEIKVCMSSKFTPTADLCRGVSLASVDFSGHEFRCASVRSGMIGISSMFEQQEDCRQSLFYSRAMRRAFAI